MDNKKKVEQITDMEVDFAQWYTDVVKKAELIDYTSAKGFIIMRPYCYAIWERIVGKLDGDFKATGHENVLLPPLIPESLLQKEKDHVVGFAPEVAWVTHGGSEELAERMCFRPTSEVLFCEHYAHIVQSWRDLPKLYNQWCTVVRWEKTTRPLLRGRELVWQEGHTLHATPEEAMVETLRMLDIYADMYESLLAMPVVKGVKTQSEKFAGAVNTYTIECMMHDGRALQSATTHYFGDGFAKAFEIAFTDKDNKLKNPHQTSWGLTTRSIGGMIMTHGDNSGLVLPPRVAPTQVVIVPVAQQKPGVLDACDKLFTELKAAGVRVKMDASDQSPGWKFAEYEMKGIPVRVELGPRDLESGQCVLARRDSGEKMTVELADVVSKLPQLLEDIQQALFDKAKQNLESRTYDADKLEEMNQPGFYRAHWCGDEACEDKVTEVTGMKSRCIPFEHTEPGHCVVCGKPSPTRIFWAQQY